MEIALLIGIGLAVAAAVYWVSRGAKAEARGEAYKATAEELEGRVRAQDELVVASAEERLREDRLRAENPATDLRNELRIAAARAKGSNSN